MPSRLILQAPTPPPPPPLLPTAAVQPHHHEVPPRIVAPIAATAAAFSLLLLLITLFRKITRKRTAPADSKPPHRFSYSVLRRATSSFSPSNRLGQGGFGSVFRGSLPASSTANGTQQSIAVKLMDHGSLQGEREFQNELFFAARLESPFVVSVLGFSSDRKRRRMLLVYDLMANGNLQDALLHRKCPELMEWKQRFSVALDIARGIEYLHAQDPPVIHGDIKPSNILLDQYFSAKLGDFGLARLKSENQCEITLIETDGSRANGGSAAKKVDLENNGGIGVEDCGSVVETESVMTGFEDINVGADLSPESYNRVPYPMTSPETVEAVTRSPEVAPIIAATPSEMLEKGSVSEGNFDRASIGSGIESASGAKRSIKGPKSSSGRDWWWKQDNGAEAGVVKDYVMEWIGTEIKKERPKSDWIGASSSSATKTSIGKSEKKKNKRRLDWWVSLDEEKNTKNGKKEKRRPAREWWKEEYCEELAKKKKRKKKRQMGLHSDDNGGEDWWPREDDLYTERKKKSRSRSRGSRGSMDRWLDGFSGELWRARRNSHDSVSGDIPKSGGISSTPSMRGTVCYIAPEYGGGGDVSEKCDVYSFGVSLLVLIAGRRPLQVTSSPMSEFQRANLLSWARHLARAGKLLDLVDQSVKSLDRDQALLCITVALLCLQKSPTKRPSMKEVVSIFTGESDPPTLPFEFSPSPPSRFPFKSQRRAR